VTICSFTASAQSAHSPRSCAVPDASLRDERRRNHSGPPMGPGRTTPSV
jgi:hypothetical protein